MNYNKFYKTKAYMQNLHIHFIPFFMFLNFSLSANPFTSTDFLLQKHNLHCSEDRRDTLHKPLKKACHKHTAEGNYIPQECPIKNMSGAVLDILPYCGS